MTKRSFVTCFILLFSIIAISNCLAQEYPEGAIKGLFSVSETEMICFSKGNLRYNVQENTWSFAEMQTSVIFSELEYPRDRASTKHYVSDQLIFDVFGWATSGWDNTRVDPGAVNYHPLSVWNRQKTETIVHSVDCSIQSILGYCDTTFAVKYNRYGFGPSNDMIDLDLVGTSANYDFGFYNMIVNGGSKKGLWRLPTKDEIEYLLYKRTNAKYLIGPAFVGPDNAFMKEGFILLPDNFVMPQGITWHYLEQCTSDELTNEYSYEQWLVLEDAGAVFLPSTFLPHPRKETGSVAYFNLGSSIEFQAEYWTSTAYRNYDSDDAWTWQPTGLYGKDREYPCAVRLVCTIVKQQGTGVNKVDSENANITSKTIENGRLVIKCGNMVYNAQGVQIR